MAAEQINKPLRQHRGKVREKEGKGERKKKKENWEIKWERKGKGKGLCLCVHEDDIPTFPSLTQGLRSLSPLPF